jgi:hypothetical protein
MSTSKPLCNCKEHREGPGPNHDKSCPWFANARLKKIHLKPEQSWRDAAGRISPLVSVEASFIIIPWVDGDISEPK